MDSVMVVSCSDGTLKTGSCSGSSSDETAILNSTFFPNADGRPSQPRADLGDFGLFPGETPLLFFAGEAWLLSITEIFS